MSDDTETLLQAMYHSEQVSAYIISKSPPGKLTTGWVEQGLMSKGLTGSLRDKINQETFVIPIDRFARLAREYADEISFGLFVLGPRSASSSKLVTILKSTNSESFKVIGFKSNSLQPQDLVSTISRLTSKKSNAAIDSETNLDYVEELLSAAADGEVRHLLALSLPADKQKAASWIQKLLKTDLESETILALYGQPPQISSTILLVSKWLLGLDMFRKTKNAIATILLILQSHTFLCLWDDKQNIASFAFIEGSDIQQTLRNFALPLWYTIDDVTKDKVRAPKVVIEQSGTKKQIRAIRSALDSQSPNSQSLSILRTRLLELTNRFSPLVSQINHIKKRTTRVINDTRIQSMNEHSENAIEELRRIEAETKTLEDISVRLRQLEKLIENGTSHTGKDPLLGSDEIQRIVSKMTTLRELIDKIEVEIGQLDSNTTEIESLKFKRQNRR